MAVNIENLNQASKDLQKPIGFVGRIKGLLAIEDPDAPRKEARGILKDMAAVKPELDSVGIPFTEIGKDGKPVERVMSLQLDGWGGAGLHIDPTPESKL